jgi:hypothetical protein
MGTNILILVASALFRALKKVIFYEFAQATEP